MNTTLGAFAPMNTFTTVFLIDSLLPPAGSSESNKLTNCTQFPEDVKSSEFQTRYQINTRIGRLFLEVLKEAADAVVNARYKDFDALVRNFGCQITALEVTRLFSEEQEELRKEADVCINDAVAGIARCKALISRTENCRGGIMLVEFLRVNLGLDIRISATMARLVRLRMLTIVNTDDDNGNPVTVPDNLYLKVVQKARPSPIQRELALLAAGIQAEESARAVAFIRDVAAKLPPDGEGRNVFLARVLAPQCIFSVVLKYSLAESPTMFSCSQYNTETVFRMFSGIVLVQNLLKMGKRDLVALPINLFMKMPENTFVRGFERLSLDKKKPILVLRGYIRNEAALIAAIKKIGLLAIIQASCVALPQFGAASKQLNAAAFLADPEVRRDMDSVREGAQNVLKLGAEQIIRTVFEIEHVYASSIAEEELL